MDDSRGEFDCQARWGHVAECAQRQGFFDFIAAYKILFDGVDAVDKDGRVRFFIEHDSNCNIASDFVLKARAIDQANGDIVAKVDVVTQDVRVDQLPDILASIVGLEIAFQELGPDLRHLGLDDLVLLVFGLAIADVTNEQ